MRRGPGQESVRDSYFVTNWNGLGTKCGVRQRSLPHPACHAVFFTPVTAWSPHVGLGLSVSSCVDLGIMIPAETSKLGIRKLCSDITVTCIRREDSVLKSSRCPSMRTEP